MTKAPSPTAQAVIDAFSADNHGVYLEGDPDRLAAAIRALVEQALPEEPPPHRGMRPGGSDLTWQESLSVERQRLRREFLAVADQLEGKS